MKTFTKELAIAAALVLLISFGVYSVFYANNALMPKSKVTVVENKTIASHDTTKTEVKKELTLWEKTKAFPGEAWDKTKEYSDIVWYKTKGYANTAWDATSDFSKGAWDKTKEYSDSTYENVKTTSKDTWKKTKDFSKSLWASWSDLVTIGD
jgi:hypothetical protein